VKKGRVLLVKGDKYEWNCPNCSDAGLVSDKKKLVQEAKKRHKVCSIPKENI
jgi:hypothetical protein